jgi:hypothetical protein
MVMLHPPPAGGSWGEAQRRNERWLRDDGRRLLEEWRATMERAEAKPSTKRQPPLPLGARPRYDGVAPSLRRLFAQNKRRMLKELHPEIKKLCPDYTGEEHDSRPSLSWMKRLQRQVRRELEGSGN